MRFDDRYWADNISDFNGDLSASKGILEACDVGEILRSRIPGCLKVKQADSAIDKTGVDWTAELQCGRIVGIDVKHRTQDYRARGKDDLALETWSVVGKRVGWTRDFNKACEWILWVWGDTGRFCMIPFSPLCAVFDLNWQRWLDEFGEQRQTSKRGSMRWQSECVYVPRLTVIQSVTDWCNGGLT